MVAAASLGACSRSAARLSAARLARRSATTPAMATPNGRAHRRSGWRDRRHGCGRRQLGTGQLDACLSEAHGRGLGRLLQVAADRAGSPKAAAIRRAAVSGSSSSVSITRSAAGIAASLASKVRPQAPAAGRATPASGIPCGSHCAIRRSCSASREHQPHELHLAADARHQRPHALGETRRHGGLRREREDQRPPARAPFRTPPSTSPRAGARIPDRRTATSPAAHRPPDDCGTAAAPVSRDSSRATVSLPEPRPPDEDQLHPAPCRTTQASARTPARPTPHHSPPSSSARSRGRHRRCRPGYPGARPGSCRPRRPAGCAHPSRRNGRSSGISASGPTICGMLPP